MESIKKENCIDKESNKPIDPVVWAKRYLEIGFCIIPVKKGEKRPAVNWAEDQKNRPIAEQIEKWFNPSNGRKFESMAVVLGKVSGDLAVRDFDDQSAYEKWKLSNPELAKVLPTVKTPRGTHVYFKMDPAANIEKTIKLKDGELRYEKSITVLPPSVHPTGNNYRWDIKPRATILTINPYEANLLESKKIDNKNHLLNQNGKMPKYCVISESTKRFLRGDAQEGERNHRLYKAACDLNGNGVLEDEASHLLLEAAELTGLSPDEARQTILSAYSTEKIPAASYVTQNYDHTLTATTQQKVKYRSRLINRNQIDYHIAGRDFLKSTYNHTVKYALRWWKQDFWYWDGKCYKTISDSQLEAIAYKWTEGYIDRPRPIDASNIVKALKSETMLKEDTQQPQWIGNNKSRGTNLLSMNNGLLDVNAVFTGSRTVLYDHTPEWFSSTAANYDYIPNADCPEFIEFLNECLENDNERIDLVQEWFGYCLLPDTSLNKMMFFEGDGANGKTVACEVLKHLVGPDNCSFVPLEVFGDRFQASTTLGKLVNICNDVGEIDKTSEGFIKMFSDGNSVQFEKKMKDPFSATPTARLTVAINNRPRFSDKTLGIWRRILIIPWNVTIPEDKQKPILKQSNHPNWPFRKELPGILNWALEGLKRLKQVNRFTKPKICKEALKEYQNECNSAKVFLEENYCYDINSNTLTLELMVNYNDWCYKNNYGAMGNNKLGIEIKRIFLQVQKKQRRINNKRVMVYEGLKLVD